MGKSKKSSGAFSTNKSKSKYSYHETNKDSDEELDYYIAGDNKDFSTPELAFFKKSVSSH
jgi:hypothetical protein